MNKQQTKKLLIATGLVVGSLIVVSAVFWLLYNPKLEDMDASHTAQSSPYVDRRVPIQINCLNNLKQLGITCRIWADDNKNQYPFNVSTNLDGTMEFCAVDKDGFDNNSALHFQVLSNELSNPRLLLCPQDPSKKPATDFQHLTPANVTYRFHSGTNVTEINARTILIVCPIDGNALFCDGSVSNHVALK